MIDDYQEAMELINTMKNCLPIPAYPSKEFVSLLQQNNIKIKTNQRLEIIKLSIFIIAGMKVEPHAF